MLKRKVQEANLFFMREFYSRWTYLPAIRRQERSHTLNVMAVRIATRRTQCLQDCVEAWLTVVAELVWTKERTLTLYLNLAQFGDGLYGIEAAAQHYFGKPASQLSRSDAAWLAVLLPAPTRYRIDPPTDYTRGQQAWILSQMAPTVGR